MSTEKKFTVGQEVWLIAQRQKPRLVPITKVGRTLVTVEEYGRPRQFRIDSGDANGSVVGYPDSIRTQDEQAEIERRAAAEKALRAAHLEIAMGYARSFHASTLEALALVANPSADLPERVIDALCLIHDYAAQRAEGED